MILDIERSEQYTDSKNEIWNFFVSNECKDGKVLLTFGGVGLSSPRTGYRFIRAKDCVNIGQTLRLLREQAEDRAISVALWKLMYE